MIEIANIQIEHEKKTVINNHTSVYSESSVNSVDLLNEDEKFEMEANSTDQTSFKQRVGSYGQLSDRQKEYSFVFEDKTDFSIMEAMGPQVQR